MQLFIVRSIHPPSRRPRARPGRDHFVVGASRRTCEHGSMVRHVANVTLQAHRPPTQQRSRGRTMVRFAINISTYMIIYVCLLLLVGVPSTANASAGTSFDSSSPFVTGPITVGLGMPGPAPRSLAARTADVVNVKDYYARGDSKGTRPSDEGVDISNEPWNNWTK